MRYVQRQVVIPSSILTHFTVQSSHCNTNWQTKILEFPIFIQSLLSVFNMYRFQARWQNSEKRISASTFVSVCPRGEARIPLDTVTSNFIFQLNKDRPT